MNAIDINKVGGSNLLIPKNKTDLRCSNLELYRIIVMLLIVAHHYVVNSGLQYSIALNPTSTSSIFYLLIGAWGKTGINCFVLITGYFMCKSSISLRKFLKLILWVITYNVLFFILFYFTGIQKGSIQALFSCFIPVWNLETGFTSCFLVFYLCIPYLNFLVKNITKQQHKWLITLLLFIYTIHGSIPSMHVSMNYISWFCTLYIISAYIRIYTLYKDEQVKFWRWLFLLSWGLSIVCIISINYLESKFCDNYDFKCYRFLTDSNTILALTNGITSFMYFKNIKMPYSKLINTIAASSFGVLLIHANSDTMRQWLWKDIFDCVGHYDTSYYWLYAIGSVITIYVGCTLIDIVRTKTIEIHLLNATETLCLNLYNKFNKN